MQYCLQIEVVGLPRLGSMNNNTRLLARFHTCHALGFISTAEADTTARAHTSVDPASIPLPCVRSCSVVRIDLLCE